MNDIETEMALFEAAKCGNDENVSMHLSVGVSVDAENLNRKLFYTRKHLMIPLLAAAEYGHVKCVQILIHHGANVNSKDKFHVTALHLAAKKGHYLCLEALLEAGAYYNMPTVNMPTSEGISPYVVGTTPLHLAAKHNKVKCVELLINFGADYNVVDVNGHTSLYIAAKGGFEDCVLTHLKNARGRDILSLPSYDTSDTPLHFAVDYCMVECVKKLIHLGSDVNIINNSGLSPLHILSCSCQKKDGSKMEIFKLLIHEGYNLDVNITSGKGLTPLYYAIFTSVSTEFATSLITYGADVNIKYKDNSTVLEHLLTTETQLSVLKCVINCMPCLPRLKSLKIDKLSHQIGEDSDENSDAKSGITYTWNSPILPDNVEFILGRDEINVYIRIRKREMPFLEKVHQARGFTENQSSSEQYYLNKPLLNLVYERVCDELKRLDDLIESISSDTRTFVRFHWYTHLLMKHCLWYEGIASNVRSLQHHCRFSIRKCVMCHRKNLTYIRNLPLPESLQSYLLFEGDD